MTSPSTKGLDPEAVAALDRWINEPMTPREYAERALMAAMVKKSRRPFLLPYIEAAIERAIDDTKRAYLAALPGAGEEQIAKAICRETCAFKGEPACFEVTGDQGEKLPWPPETCDEPGCVALAMAVRACLPAPGGR